MQVDSKMLVQVGIGVLLAVVALAAFYMLFDVRQLQFINNLSKYPGVERYNVIMSGTVFDLGDGFIEISKGGAKMDLTTNDATQYAATEHNWDVLAPVPYDSSKLLIGEEVRAIGFIEKGTIVADIVIHLDSQ